MPVTRLPRENHPVSRKLISSATLQVLNRLRDAGYAAYMVGGGVRDILAGVTPKDFDVATDARPEQVRQIFGRQCRLVGRRFVIAHVVFGNEQVEVTTFRGGLTESHARDETGRILSDNVYGTLETDALRRDFTVNALYYDIRDFSLLDFAGGFDDMDRRQIRLIGDDAETRYREDPVRMLRAVRIASKLGFEIHPESAEPIPRLAHLLREVPAARLFDEVLKLLLSRDAVANWHGMRRYGLFTALFPMTARLIEANVVAERFVEAALAATADRLDQGLPVSPAFLYAAVLWPPVAARAFLLTQHEGRHPNDAMIQAGEEVLARQFGLVAIPKRFSLPMREIWMLQNRFDQRRGNRPRRTAEHPRFRAAFDFLCLRAAAGEGVAELATWWRQALGMDPVPDIDAPDEASDVTGEISASVPAIMAPEATPSVMAEEPKAPEPVDEDLHPVAGIGTAPGEESPAPTVLGESLETHLPPDGAEIVVPAASPDTAEASPNVAGESLPAVAVPAASAMPADPDMAVPPTDTPVSSAASDESAEEGDDEDEEDFPIPASDSEAGSNGRRRRRRGGRRRNGNGNGGGNGSGGGAPSTG